MVGLDEQGTKVVEARGVPPGWVRDIPGTEAWALFQAGTIAEPGSVFKCDCKPCVDAVHNGAEWACAAHRPLARVFRLVHTALDDVEVEDVVWMPAHTKPTDVLVRELGNGQLLTERDRRGNALADANAKAAAEVHRVPRALVETEIRRIQRAKEAARWLGRVSWLATNQKGPVPKDNDGSRAEAVRAARARGEPAPGPRKRRKRVEAGGDGAGTAGHQLEKTGGGGWRCSRCLVGGSRDTIVKRRCRGEAVDRWKQTALRRRAAEAGVDEADGAPQVVRYRHQRMRTGKVVWCNLCGAYGETKAVKLALVCPGQVEDNHTGGQCLRALRKGRHPKTGAFLGEPVPEHLWEGGGNVAGHGGAVDAPATRDGDAGSSARARLTALRARVRARELAAKGGEGKVEGRAAPGSANGSKSAETTQGGKRVREPEEAAAEGSAGARRMALRMRVRAREQAREAAMGERRSGNGGGGGGSSVEAAPGGLVVRECTSVEDALDGTNQRNTNGLGGAYGASGGNGGRPAEARVESMAAQGRASGPGGDAMELD